MSRTAPIDATLHLQESRAREISFALGADSYLGFIFRTTYTDRNLWGELLGFSVGVEASSRGLLGETRITEPWLFGTDLSATARLYSLSYSPDGYTSQEAGLEGSVTWAVNDHYVIEVLAGYSITDLSSGRPSRVRTRRDHLSEPAGPGHPDDRLSGQPHPAQERLARFTAAGNRRGPRR